MRAIFTICFSLLLCAAVGSCPSLAAGEHEHEHPAPEKLGAVNFPTSCSPMVQKQFERAVALLHSFAYSAAEKAFREVEEADPKCAMAHWGVAMTYFHQLWEPQLATTDLERGRLELDRAKQLGGSERERGFIEALSLIYTRAEAVPYRERAKAYALAMGKLADRHRKDVECQVFYALGLLATASSSDSTHGNEKKAVALLEPLFQQYPQHPGIPHYLIHACDNSEMARHGLAAAQVYAQIAPSAPHALHMPSHIYTRLGMWQDSVASNLAARTAAQAQGDIGEQLHAMDYLTYAYLQLGRDSEAASLVQDLRTMAELHAAEFKVGYAATAMPVRYAIERRQWKEAAQLLPMAGAQPQVLAITAWARAVGFARSAEPAAAQPEINKLKSFNEQLQRAGDEYWASQVHVQTNEALAWIAHAEERDEEAVSLLRAAADEEDAIEKRPVTPGPIVPAREQLADLLLESKHPKEARKEFESVLTMAPQRRAALAGAAQATDMAGIAK
jgi:tetratricopeptide (TPR) repeat protein